MKKLILAAEILAIAQKFIEVLTPHCTRCVIAGSLRRGKPYVSDIEILLVSRMFAVKDPQDLLGHSIDRPGADIILEDLLERGVIQKRANKHGHFAWGDENKLAVHTKSGTPVDFFFTTEEKWFNALIVRTGPAELNKRIAQAAIDKGWSWHAYGDGFTRNDGKASIDKHRATSELDVFQFVGIPFLIPEDR